MTYNKNERINDFVEIMYENLCQLCTSEPVVEKQNPINR